MSIKVYKSKFFGTKDDIHLIKLEALQRFLKNKITLKVSNIALLERSGCRSKHTTKEYKAEFNNNPQENLHHISTNKSRQQNGEEHRT